MTHPLLYAEQAGVGVASLPSAPAANAGRSAMGTSICNKLIASCTATGVVTTLCFMQTFLQTPTDMCRHPLVLLALNANVDYVSSKCVVLLPLVLCCQPVPVMEHTAHVWAIPIMGTGGGSSQQYTASSI